MSQTGDMLSIRDKVEDIYELKVELTKSESKADFNTVYEVLTKIQHHVVNEINDRWEKKTPTDQIIIDLNEFLDLEELNVITRDEMRFNLLGNAMPTLTLWNYFQKQCRSYSLKPAFFYGDGLIYQKLYLSKTNVDTR